MENSNINTIAGDEQGMKAKSDLQSVNTLSSLITNIVNAVEDGWLDPSDAFISFRNAEKLIKGAMTMINDQVIDQIDTGQPVEIGDQKLEVRNGAGRWTFTDDDHNDLKVKLKAMEDDRKQAYKMHLNGQVMVNQMTGEIIPPAEFTPGKRTIFMSKKKS